MAHPPYSGNSFDDENQHQYEPGLPWSQEQIARPQYLPEIALTSLDAVYQQIGHLITSIRSQIYVDLMLADQDGIQKSMERMHGLTLALHTVFTQEVSSSLSAPSSRQERQRTPLSAAETDILTILDETHF